MRRERNERAGHEIESFWLEVPAGDEAAVTALGARFDESTQRWWGFGRDGRVRLARWMPGSRGVAPETVTTVIFGLLGDCPDCNRSGTSLVGMVERGDDWRVAPGIRHRSDAFLLATEAALPSDERGRWCVGALARSALTDAIAPTCYACGAVLDRLYDVALPRAIDAFGLHALHAIAFGRLPADVWANLQAEARTALGLE